MPKLSPQRILGPLLLCLTLVAIPLTAGGCASGLAPSKIFQKVRGIAEVLLDATEDTIAVVESTVIVPAGASE